MKFPIFNQYLSINISIYLAAIELILFVPIILSHLFLFSSLSLDILFLFSMLSITLLCIIHYYLLPICLILILVEFYLRKTGRIIKTNVVNIPVKFQKYIYIATVLIYIAVTIVGIIAGQPMTEEELRYD